VTRLAAFVAVTLLAAAWTTVTTTGTVRVTLDDRMQARPIEGYVWFVGLDRARRVPATARAVTLRGSGGHRVVSFIRTCDGNCSVLDAPSKRCVRSVTLRAGVVRRATVRLLDSGCRILLR
jgi:hypothetical protein